MVTRGDGSRTSYTHTLQIGLGTGRTVELTVVDRNKTNYWSTLSTVIYAALMDDTLVHIEDDSGNELMIRPSEIAWITQKTEKVAHTRVKSDDAPF